ncbi:ADP-ribose pyrophosphatase [uncultured archaeon]|nr:ADP-ribose pyrophosphatase [uncultured archaeon]
MISLQKPADFNPVFEVVSCFVEKKGKIILLHRQDHAREGNTWGVPAGKLKDKETLTEGVLREIKEETGITLKEPNLKYFKKIYVKYPNYDFVYHIFQTKIKGKEEIKLNPEEHKNYKWITPKNALKMNLIEDEDACIKLFYKI